MRIIHVEFAKYGHGLSGGEETVIENIKYWISVNIKNILYTTNNAKKTYEKLGLVESDLLEYRTVELSKFEQNIHPFFSYVIRTIYALMLMRHTNLENSDVLFCHSDYFPNSIPFYFLVKKNKRVKIFYWFHSLVPSLFRGYEGVFTKTFHIPTFSLIHHILNQKLFGWLIFPKGTLLTVNGFYGKYLKEKFPLNDVYVFHHLGGPDNIIMTNKPKKYDLAWMGRFQSLKGLSQIFEIVKSLKINNKDIKILVIGGGDIIEEKKFINRIRNEDFTNNIVYKGFIHGKDRFEYLKEAKLFLMTSMYESFGLVNVEAMKCGLPVVAYNLPVYDVFKMGMIKVTLLDSKKMSEEISRLLNDEVEYTHIRDEALMFSVNFSWKKTGEELHQLVLR